MGEVYLRTSEDEAFRVEETREHGVTVVAVKGRESVTVDDEVAEDLCGELDHPELANYPTPLVGALLQLLAASVTEDMRDACLTSTGEEEALSKMSFASLQTILREIGRYGDQHTIELGSLLDAYAKCTEAVDEYYRLSDLDMQSNEGSLRVVQSELLATAERQRNELCIARIVDSDWWQEVVR